MKNKMIHFGIKAKTRIRSSDMFAYVCAFLSPIIILLIVFYKNEIYPFGDYSLMTQELFDRFVPFFSELQRKISHSESLFYTWNIAGGLSFWAVIGKYLSSPFNLFLLPFSTIHLPMGISLLVLLRTGCSGLFLSIFIRKKEPNINNTILLLFAMAYSLGGYAVAYFWAFMWLDAFVFLPLVILGVYYVVQGKRPTLFTLSLLLVFINQYVLGLFVLVFSLCMALIFYIEIEQTNKSSKRMLVIYARLLFSSVLSFGMASFILIPTLRVVAQARSSHPFDIVDDFVSELTLFDVGTRLLFGTTPAIDYKAPNIYISMGLVFLVFLFGMCSKIRFSERLITILLTLAVYVLMTSRMFNYYVDGMRFLDSNHYKYSFLVSFILVYMGIRVVSHLRADAKNHVIAVTVGMLIFIVLYNQAGNVKPDSKMIYTVLLFVILYAILWALFCLKERKQHIVSLLLLLLMGIELLSSATGGYAFLNEKTSFERHSRYIQELNSFEKPETSDRAFYRNIFLNPYSENDGALFGVADIGGTSDLQNRGFIEFIDFLGMLDANDQLDPNRISFFAIHFLILENIYQQQSETENIGQGHYYTNLHALPAKEDIKYNRIVTTQSTVSGIIIFDNSVSVLLPDWGHTTERWKIWLEYIDLEYFYVLGSIDYKNGTNVQYDEENSVIYSVNPGRADFRFGLEEGQDSCLLLVNANQTAIIRIRFDRDATQPAFIRNWSVSGPAVVDALSNLEHSGTNASGHILFDNVSEEGFEILVFDTDFELYEDFINAYHARGFHANIWQGNIIEGNITSDSNGTLVLSVPYDAGWSARVNGQQVSAVRSFGGLLGVPVVEGNNVIELVYVPAGLKMGVILSLQSVAVFLLLVCFNPFGTYYDSKKKKS